MKWWYENEDNGMKVYKDPKMCEKCKAEFFSKPYDHRDATPGQIGYCVHCDNCLIKDKESKMEFLKERVYTAINADELKAGDKVIVANSPYYLKKQVEEDDVTDEIMYIATDTNDKRFRVDRSGEFALAYLVERKENCTNCGKTECAGHSEHEDFKVAVCSNWIPKAEPKTEQKAEPHYRPFKDTDELIKVWCEKGGKWQKRELTMPLIWVHRDCTTEKCLIVSYTNDSVYLGHRSVSLQELFDNFGFFDGSPCGVEE